MYKHRRARDKTQTRLVSNSSKLTGGTSEAPIELAEDGGGSNDLRVELPGEDGGARDGDASDDDIVLTAAQIGGGRPRQTAGADAAPPNLLVEDSDEEVPVALDEIPDIQSAQPIKLEEDDDDGSLTGAAARRPKRRRQEGPMQIQDSDDDVEDNSDGDSLFVSENEDAEDILSDIDVDARDLPAPKRTRVVPPDSHDDNNDDTSRKKKKLAMDIIYEGFAIYGRVLCLVVKRRGGPLRGRGGGRQTTLSASAGSGRAGNPSASAEPTKPGGQAAMENWIASTQMPAAEDMS